MVNLLADAAGLGNSIVHGAEYVGNAIKTHPVQSAVLVATGAALAAGAVFTGGADLAAAPEIVSAETGAVTGTAALDGVAAAGVSDAGAAATDASAIARAGEEAAGASRGPGLSQSLGPAIRNIGTKLGGATLRAAKYGIIGEGVNIGLTMASKGIANITSAVFGTQAQIPYPNINPFATGGYGSYPNTLGTSAPSPGSSGPSSLLSQLTGGTGIELIALAAVLFIGYEAVKHKA